MSHRRILGLTVAVFILSDSVTSRLSQAADMEPATPIKHLIVVIGENRTFDSLFATYRSGSASQSVQNLLSEGIILSDGSPGPNFGRAAQNRAMAQDHYTLDPPRAGPYIYLPQPTLIGVADTRLHKYSHQLDARVPATLADGPFQISRYISYTNTSMSRAASSTALVAATGDPVHRFFQMWQQVGAENAKLDLFVWVAINTGMGGDTPGITAKDIGQGGELMGFVNMAGGDAKYFRELADRYTMSDNYHQSIMGGTSMNFFALATGDLPYFNVNGQRAAPTANQIEDPTPSPGTANFYRRDGHQGGSYVNCSDPAQPGVAAILDVLAHMHVNSRCESGTYYLVNNYSAGYDLDGHPQPLGPDNYTYPPQSVPTVAEALAQKGVSWKWYTGGREGGDLKNEIATLHLSPEAARKLQYNDTGDPLVASTAVMTRPALRSNLQGLHSLYHDLARGTLPAVSFVVPKNLDSGHPGYSIIASYERFLHDIVDRVQKRPRLWAHTAIVATTDEGGGYFDSGSVQVLDFFGDGPRIPLLVISPYARRGYVDHTYGDHASILKFIERNWRLAPLSLRSRDNLPNPISDSVDPYRPMNSPAIGDLMTAFDF